MIERLYLDHAASSPLLPEARDAMAPWLEGAFGNPSSLHAEGRRARAAIDEAREALAGALGALFGEVLFVSSGTEAAHLALVGTALASKGRRRVLMGAAEHHCVLGARPMLERLGFIVQLVSVDRWARIDVEALEAVLGDDVLLVAAMHANNELGSVQDVRRVAELAHRSGAMVFVDAVQTFGVLPWTVDALGADLVSVSAHKIGGPKGVGALCVRGGVPIEPVLAGGGQERDMRAGTENVAGIVGLGAAAHVQRSRSTVARDAFRATIGDAAAWSLDANVPCLPGHAHLRFPGATAESMLIVLDRMGVAASSGAACSSGSLEPSHVMIACGYSDKEAKQALRFTFGPGHSKADGIEAARRVLAAAQQIAP